MIIMIKVRRFFFSASVCGGGIVMSLGGVQLVFKSNRRQCTAFGGVLDGHELLNMMIDGDERGRRAAEELIGSSSM
jgi:hypothetical protein